MSATESLPSQSATRRAATAVAGAGGWSGLDAAARLAGVELDADQRDRFRRYRDLLVEWNGRFNLTAIAAPAAIEQRLFLDAIRMLPALDRYAPAGSGDGPAVRLVDIGSGAGFPGLPLAICRPDLSVTLVEATGKKVAFLDAATADLDLPNVRSIHARAEELGHEPAYRGAYDLATARAVASLPALLELTMPLLRPHGVALLPKGLDLGEELAAGQRAARVVGARLVADELLSGGETRLIVARKEESTPARFPRRAGIPAREPLGGPRPPRRSSPGQGGPSR